MRATVEPFKALLARAEKERDEARQASSESARQVQQLEKEIDGSLLVPQCLEKRKKRRRCERGMMAARETTGR